MTSPLNQGFGRSQPKSKSMNKPEGSDQLNSSEKKNEINSPGIVKPICDTFETGIIGVAEKVPEEMEANKQWPEEDIEAIADLLSSCCDSSSFQEQFYPQRENPWIPASILNRAVKKLAVEKYELIKVG